MNTNNQTTNAGQSGSHAANTANRNPYRVALKYNGEAGYRHFYGEQTFCAAQRRAAEMIRGRAHCEARIIRMTDNAIVYRAAA